MAKRKDIPSVRISGSADTSIVRKSGRETLANKQVAPTPATTLNSTRFEKQTAPVATFVKKRPENSEKQMGPSPLRRSERGKNPDDGPATNVKSTEDVNKDGNTETQDPPEVSGRKRKRFNAIRFKARFKPQRVLVESDDEDSEGEGGASTSEVKTIINGDGDKEVEDRDKGVGKCGDEADGQSVQGSRDRAQKAVLEEGLIAADQEEHVGCPSQTKPVEGESIESGNVEKQIGGNCSPSNGHIADTSLSRINHVLENQQELDLRDKVTGTSKPAGVMENAENNNANTNAGSIVNSSKFVEYWVPVQLSNVQLEQYCASLLSNAAVFQSCSKSVTDDALLEILNSNRKCCNHPYLVDAKLQGKVTMGLVEPTRILDVDIKVSGKLQFLDLVLPEVKKRQLRALILYQPTSGSASVGPVLAEFVHQRFGQDSYERLDGVGIASSKKQTALSNFNNEKNRFIFLLASNACNSTVKLSSIDLVIIFDSDLNPSTDIKSLQKISIDSQSEQIMVVRLYTSLTLEEKILKLADHDNMIQNLRSKYNALLMWGASDLFNRLEEFHSRSDNNISSEESILNNVVKEFLHIISHKSESDDTTKSFITRVESCGSYGKNIMFQSEIKTLLPDGDHPRVFWKKLLEGQNPVWKFRSESTPRQRKRPNFFSDSCGVNTRRKTVKDVVEGETGRSNEGVPVQNESRLSSGDHFWSTAVGNETSVGNEENVHDLLKPTVSELCKILKFSENVTTIVESFLKFVIENFQVLKKHTSTLQALMISVCWIGSSLSKYMIDMIDREQSFALAKKHLNFICSKEEADQVYEKLQSAKETFLQNTKDLEIVNNIEECTMPHPEPRTSNSVPLNPQESKPENRDSSNEETLQSTKQILKEDLARKDENEIDKFNRAWDEKRMKIENEREVDKAFFRYLHPGKSSFRSEMLKKVEENFTNKLKEHERLRVIHLSDLKAKLNASVGQLVVNDERSLHGPAHETQIVDLVRSEKGDQGSAEVAPSLSGNPSEAQIRDKSLHEMCPVVVPAEVIIISDDSSDEESIGSHSSEKQTADAMVKTEPIMENDVTVDNATLLSEPIGHISAIEEIVSSIPIEENASELHDEVENDVVGADARVLSEIGDIPAKQGADMENDVAGADATVSSEPIGDIPDIEEIASEQHGEIENSVSEDDALVLTEPIGDISAKQHDDMEIDVAGQDESLEMEVPEVDFNKENAKEGTSSPDGSHAVKARIETGQNDLTPHVNLVEMEIPAIHNLRPHVDSADGSRAVEEAIGTGSNDVSSHAKSPELEMPVGNDMASNVDSTDESRPSADPNATGPNDVVSHVDSGELEILADNDPAPHVDSAADGLNAVEDGNETTPSYMAQLVDPCEINMPAVNDVAPNVDSADGSHAIQDPPNETGLYDMSRHVDSDETGMPADIDMAPNDYSANMSHAAEDPNKNGSNDVSLHADSEQMGIPAANDLTPHIESADGSHADEDSNGTGPNHVAPNGGSSELGIPAGNCNQENALDTTPAVQQVASPVSDHSMPAIPEIHSDFQLIQQSSENGIQDQGQADPTPMVEIEDDNIIPEDSSLNPQDEPSLVMSTNPTITENQAAVLPTNEVLVQTTAPPITAQTQIQNASLLEQYMSDLQLNANSNQVGSRMTPRVDPLLIELKQLSSVKEKMVKSYEDNIQKINIDCEKEIAEAIAKIRLKYCTKRQEADATFNSQKKEVENNMNTVFINQVLATVCRRKGQDVTSGRAALQQACQAESMQQLHRSSGPSSLPGQSSGSQQTPPPPPPPISATTTETPPQQTQPPLQIVHQPSALFSTPLTRHPHTTNLRPANTTPIRLPPNTNPITPSTPTTTSRPLTTITPITPSTTPSTIISPHGMNHLTPSTTPIRPLFNSNPFRTFAATPRINTETCGQSPQGRPLVSSVTHSTAPHMRPMVSREIRTPGPHMRPFASSDVRSSTSHMRPSNSISSSGPPGSGTYHRILPVQHVTSSFLLTSPSNSQPLNSTSSVQPRSESPQPPPPSQLPHASAATSSHSSSPRGPSVPQSGGPQDKLNDNVNAVTDNAARRLNILKTPEFSGGGTAAQPPAAHEVVYLSDDD